MSCFFIHWFLFLGEGNRTPNKRDKLRQRWQARDEACFGSPSNNGFDEDFDFESNLALFDKQVRVFLRPWFEFMFRCFSICVISSFS